MTISTPSLPSAIEELPHPSLFEVMLGAEIDRLPEPVRSFHRAAGARTYTGLAEVHGAKNALGRMLARVLRFPVAAASSTVAITVRPTGCGEIWTRRFSTSAFTTLLTPGPRPGQVTEHFGLASVDLSIIVHDEGLELTVEGWRIGPLPLPKFIGPWTHACERQDSLGRFAFDVEIGFSLIGRIVRYHGAVAPLSSPPAAHTTGSQATQASPIRE